MAEQKTRADVIAALKLGNRDFAEWILYRADLREANLRGANLRRSALYRANLREANLYRADLRGANLYRADLYRADLREANLYEADLRGANLHRADLRGANLYEADLRGANLRGADLGTEDSSTRKYIESVTLVPPETGQFDGWKAARDAIVHLRVPEQAQRSSATGRKCRVSEALVVAIYDRYGTPIEGPVYSRHDPSFPYRLGETVRPAEDFDPDRWNECGSGIHLFLTRYEAESY